ncbi:polysaccharide deacetylase family protein [Flavobacterium enshiense]|uniref:polysaccharide deacetylase family protein n=1 Tax=Flavobacterium enshiense TaxID=1341165 RepID=UPI00345DB4F2
MTNLSKANPMNLTAKRLLFSILFLCASLITKGQLRVAITVDDVPNKTFFIKDKGEPVLLNTLDSLKIPVGIFINEGKLFQEDSLIRRNHLDNWANRNYVTLGNHTFSHLRYSDVGFDAFTADVKKGEIISRGLARKNGKNLKYFRFPYNDLGKDSLQHQAIKDFLKQNNYQLTPFTIESIDWMYNYVYEYYLSQNERQKAQETGQAYVAITLAYFEYVEKLSQEKYGRDIRQIYMCHDNILNAVYLPSILEALRLKNYKFISLKKALKDKVYQQKDYYTKKWGISWVYRWMDNAKERTSLMKAEPNTEAIENLYNTILKENKQ